MVGNSICDESYVLSMVKVVLKVGGMRVGNFDGRGLIAFRDKKRVTISRDTKNSFRSR